MSDNFVLVSKWRFVSKFVLNYDKMSCLFGWFEN